MKRGGAEVALVHLEWVRRTHQWGSSRRCQALSQGGRALPCFVKGDVLRRQTVLVLAMQSLPLGAAHAATLPRARLRPAACGPDGVLPRGGVSPMLGQLSSIECEALIGADEAPNTFT
eukprot:scaffold90710_cov98-Phaeocystis_antarctica.AAC.2